MNLYRSFGNLLEAWMTEGGGQNLDPELPANDGEEDSLTEASPVEGNNNNNPRSESVDSGVETACSDTFSPNTSCCVSPVNTDLDMFAPNETGGPVSSPSSSPSRQRSPLPYSPEPPLSSSSSYPRLPPSRAQEASAALHLKLERTLQRSGSKRLDKDTLRVPEAEPEANGNVVLRRKPRGISSFLPKRYSSEIVRGQRAECFDPRRSTNSLSVPTRHEEEITRRRPQSMRCDVQLAQTRPEFRYTVQEHHGETDGRGLSPGLSYLEHVCQMLEDFARRQLHIEASQMETNAPGERGDMEVGQAPSTCQSDPSESEAPDAASVVKEEDILFCERLENMENATQSPREAQPGEGDIHGQSRRRSASEAALCQAPDTCQSDLSGPKTPDAAAAVVKGEDISVCKTLENAENAAQSPTEAQQGKDGTRTHFRQRSASDTTLATLHLRRMNAHCRGQHQSEHDLLEKDEEEHKKEESKKEKTNTPNRNRKFKLGSLGRGVSSLRDTTSEQTQPPERLSARRRLSKLFRRKRRKTLPV